MSISSKSDGDTFGVNDLLEIETRCRELRKEKDMVKESQSEGFELIRRLDQHVKTLSHSRSKDKMQIEDMDRELRNCSQEIDYLQDQLNSRDSEILILREQVRSFSPKLTDMENLRQEVCRLRDELRKSVSAQMLLLEELENKEIELQNLTRLIEKLEESLSSSTLETQFEIESMKLDIMDLEQSCLDAKKIREETVQENDRMNRLIHELEVEHRESRKNIECLKDEINGDVFCPKIGNHFEEPKPSEDKDRSRYCASSSKLISPCRDVFDPHLTTEEMVAMPNSILMVKIENMLLQIHEYELLVDKLKEDLRAEKIKAKDEAEDLVQEMAELRYQYTNMLEEECKRRVCIEQASLQRIGQLETQIQNEGRKSLRARNLSET